MLYKHTDLDSNIQIFYFIKIIILAGQNTSQYMHYLIYSQNFILLQALKELYL